MNIGRLFRTVRHLKPIQVAARFWNKVPRRRPAETPLPARGVCPQTAFPRYYPCWDGGTAFTFLHETHEVRTPADWNNPAWPKLWLYNLHYFDCLRGTSHIAISDVPRDRVDGATGLLVRWMAENPVGRGNGWEPYPISLRVVNWIKWLVSGAGAPVGTDLRARMERSLCVQVRYLRKRLEYHLLANHLLANAKALVFAGTYFAGSEAESLLRKGMDLYRRQLPEQILADGIHFERSAMYHAIIFEDLLDCFNLTGDMFFVPWIERMRTGLDLLTGPDGRLAKFNDAAEGIALSPAELQAYAERLGEAASRRFTGTTGVSPVAPPPVAASCDPPVGGSGFVRMEAGAYVVLAKTGEIGPSYQPGHAHADTWTFELWKDGAKAVTDTGCSTYVPGAVRSYERGTRAHNTVVVDGRDSSEVWASHRVGRRFDPAGHRRAFSLTEEGLSGVDEVGGRGVHDVEIRFHLMPGAAVEVSCAGERSEESCEIAEGFGLRVPARCVVFRSRVTLPARFEWRVR